MTPEIDMTPRYTPDRVLILGHGIVPVIGSTFYPANTHKSIIRAHMCSVELRTAYGSRWYGCESAYINSELRMVIIGTNRRDEVRMKWDIVPEDLR